MFRAKFFVGGFSCSCFLSFTDAFFTLLSATLLGRVAVAARAAVLASVLTRLAFTTLALLALAFALFGLPTLFPGRGGVAPAAGRVRHVLVAAPSAPALGLVLHRHVGEQQRVLRLLFVLLSLL